jgi:hypothetical protein
MWSLVIEYLEKPQRIDRQIQKLIAKITRKGRRIKRIALNAEESQIFWEDIVDDGIYSDDYATLVDNQPYEYFGVKIRFEKDVLDGINPED